MIYYKNKLIYEDILPKDNLKITLQGIDKLISLAKEQNLSLSDYIKQTNLNTNNDDDSSLNIDTSTNQLSVEINNIDNTLFDNIINDIFNNAKTIYSNFNK